LTPSILIVEDERQAALWLKLHVETIWPECQPRLCAAADLDASLDNGGASDTEILLMGIRFGNRNGSSNGDFGQLRTLRRRHMDLQILVVASNGSELTAVRSLQLGASDYLPRDLLTPQLLAQRLRAALRRSRLHLARERKRLADASAVMDSVPGAQALEESGDAEKPVIPRYSLKKLLGESSRAEVWLGTSEELEKDVAIKISRLVANEDEEQSLFAREYAAIAALNHRGVVEIYDYGVHERREYLAMEYFPSGDLKHRMKRQFTPRLSLTYLKRITEALLPVHAAGLMHLDLKPANIMVRNNGEVVLIDFGLVKHMDSMAGSTAVGVRRGSPHYMSPEQVTGLTLDARSDIYSLGVIYYEMLTGHRPYKGTTAIELMESHVNEPRPALPQTLAQYEPLLNLMMTKNRDTRLADASELMAWLLREGDRLNDVPLELALAHA
jgi:eukaryotic-like serine/threonine-protein kinase